jgi:hypothetical protein
MLNFILWKYSKVPFFRETCLLNVPQLLPSAAKANCKGQESNFDAK